MVLWPLRGAPQKTWNASTLFQAKRPWGGTQKRYHAGLDLKAGEGDDILAPEDLTVVAVDRGWDGTAKATLVHTASGHSLLLGCTLLGSARPVDTQVKAGEVVARVGFYTRTSNGQPVKSSMLHLQVYDAPITPSQANAWQSWSLGNPQPPHLIDPQTYLSGATPVQPDAGAEGGPLTLDVPCPLVDGLPVCLVSHTAHWAAELAKCIEATLETYAAAGWAEMSPLPAHIEAAAALFNEAADVLDTYKDGDLPGTTAEQVHALTDAIVDCSAARAAFVPSPPATTSGGGGLGVAVAVGVGLVVVGGGLYVLTRKKR